MEHDVKVIPGTTMSTYLSIQSHLYTLHVIISFSDPLHCNKVRYARFSHNVSDDQRAPEKGAHDCATNVGEVPQRYLSRPLRSHLDCS